MLDEFVLERHYAFSYYLERENEREEEGQGE